MADTKSELRDREYKLIGKVEDTLMTLMVDTNSDDDDIQWLRFKEDELRDVLKELNKPSISNRMVNILVTRVDVIESRINDIIKQANEHRITEAT